MKRQFWRETWREEFRFESDAEHAHTKKEIDAWLASNKVQQDAHQQFHELLASAKTGIPHGIEMPLPAALDVRQTAPMYAFMCVYACMHTPMPMHTLWT